MCFLTSGQNALSFFKKKKGSLIFGLCFLLFVARFLKKGPQAHVRGLLRSENGRLGTFDNHGGPFWLGRCVLSVSVVFCLSVETVMECQMRVSDVFCAVSLSGTATASSSTAAGPAWSRSSCCPCQRLPSFQRRTVPVRSGPSRTQNAVNTWGFETHDAVVHGFGVLCVVVRRCAMW